jgi:uncharacterized cupredoxin-like copper-binding protein
MRLRFASTLALSLFLLARASVAVVPAEVVAIKLQDSTVDPSIGHMRIAIDRTELKPGRITFEAVNQSKSLTHEVVVVHNRGALPFDAKHDRVNEQQVRRLGEIADLAPGATGKLTLNLGPGTYELFCNEPGHYKDGMIAKVVVAP